MQRRGTPATATLTWLATSTTGRAPQAHFSSAIAWCLGNVRSRRSSRCPPVSQSTSLPQWHASAYGLGSSLAISSGQILSSPACSWTTNLRFSSARTQSSTTKASTLRCTITSSKAALRTKRLPSTSSAPTISSRTSSPRHLGVSGSSYLGKRLK